MPKYPRPEIYGVRGRTDELGRLWSDSVRLDPDHPITDDERERALSSLVEAFVVTERARRYNRAVEEINYREATR